MSQRPTKRRAVELSRSETPLPSTPRQAETPSSVMPTPSSVASSNILSGQPMRGRDLFSSGASVSSSNTSLTANTIEARQRLQQLVLQAQEEKRSQPRYNQPRYSYTPTSRDLNQASSSSTPASSSSAIPRALTYTQPPPSRPDFFTPTPTVQKRQFPRYVSAYKTAVKLRHPMVESRISQMAKSDQLTITCQTCANDEEISTLEPVPKSIEQAKEENFIIVPSADGTVCWCFLRESLEKMLENNQPNPYTKQNFPEIVKRLVKNDVGQILKFQESDNIEVWKNQYDQYDRLDGPAKIIYDQNGNKSEVYYYSNGVLHRDYGLPAIVKYVDGHPVYAEWRYNGILFNPTGQESLIYVDNLNNAHFEWYNQDSRLSRENDPAVVVIDKDGKMIEQIWIKNSQYHRRNGPAKITYDPVDGTTLEQYFVNGFLDRNQAEGPAIIKYDSTGNKVLMIWAKKDKYHRDKFPAVIVPNQKEEWWQNGNKTEEVQNNIKNIYKMENGINYIAKQILPDSSIKIFKLRPDNIPYLWKHFPAKEQSGPVVEYNLDGSIKNKF